MAKFAALLVLCLVFFAAVQVLEVHAHADDVYGNCLPECLKGCEKEQGNTFCEMKCDTDCFNEDVKSKLDAATKN